MEDNVLVFDEKNFEAEVVGAKGKVMVDFWAAWCVPCKMIAPHVEELAKEYAGRVKFGKVNVDENRSLSAKYGIRGIPAILLFKDGQVVNNMIGVHSKQEIADLIEKTA